MPAVTIPRLPSDLPTSRPQWVGQPMKRVEDPSLLTGRAEFTDNLTRPGMLHCAILRSPHASARIRHIDTSAAERLPGVMAVVTGEDARRWLNPLPAIATGTSWSTHVLAVDRVRFAGEPVAAVAATSRYVAEDALDLITVDYEPLPVLLGPEAPLDPDSPKLFADKPDNIVYQRLFRFGDVDAAFAQADHIVTDTLRWHRVSGNPMETFGVICEWDPIDDKLTCRGAFQSSAGSSANIVASVARLPTNRVRIIGLPHGGSFGTKGGSSKGLMTAALLSRMTGGRPVKWIEDRLEHLRGASTHCWDRIYEGQLAVTREGKFTAFKVKLVDDLGAYAEGIGAGQTLKPLACFTNCYTIASCEYDVKVVVSNKVPQGAYRGLGPPPHFVLLEGLVDLTARQLGLDRAEIRRANYIRPEQFPYTLPTGNEYDSGNYQAALNKLLEISDYAQLARDQTAARARGKLHGIGLVNTIELGALGMNHYNLLSPTLGTSTPEGCTLRISAAGKIVAGIGFPLEGEGQPTFVTQILADYFGVPPGDIEVVTLDSLTAAPGQGPGGSRLAVALGGAVMGAADLVRQKLVKVASVMLEVDQGDVELMDGNLRVKGAPGKSLPFADVAKTMLTRSDLLPPDVDGSPEATYVWNAPGRTMPDKDGRVKSYLTAANACHLVVLEIDPDTGQVEILKYFIADDCGTRLNPASVEGQVQGGVAQGLGMALLEEYVYDERGQLLTTTYMDYLLPTIHDVPLTTKAALVTPSPVAPLGAKGTGEGPVHTTPAAIMCAINDALNPLGVRSRETPATPVRLWQLLQEAAARSAT